VVLFLVGAAVLRAGFTDLYLRYVKEGLRPLLLAAGVILIVVAIATVWYERRQSHTTREKAQKAQAGRTEAEAESEAETESEPGPAHQDGGGHTHREPRISWLLVLPLLALILVAPPAAGSYSAGRSGTALKPPPGFPALPAGHTTLQLSVLDYASRVVYDHGRALDHRRIKMTGFISVDGSGKSYLTRMVLNCCAADAQPVKVGLSGRTLPVVAPDTWLEVTGTYTDKKVKDPASDGVIPFIDVSRAKRVPAPKDPYGE
jgi:uncharacterized repeat protein (TIGR03943 family)